jgi:hypothetical protein
MKEKDKKLVSAIVSQSEHDEIQRFINKIGIDQSTFIRNSLKTFIYDFYRRYDSIENLQNKPETLDQDIDIEDITFDIESFRSIASSNRDESFFKNEKVADRYIINYAGSQFDVNLVDMIRMEFFIYEELGFPHEHIINWKSPLLGLLLSYQHYCEEFKKTKQP